MAKKQTEKGLGRGLGALFGDEAMISAETSDSRIPISHIEAGPKQPRTTFEETSLEDLAESIRIHGVLQPIIVRRLASGYYQIISGERRWRASRKAGLTEIPAVIIEADDRKCLEIGLIENLQREDLNPMEEAEGFRRLMDEFGLTQEEVAERVGKSRPAVANALRILALPESVRALVTNGDLSAGHARALLPLGDEEKIFSAARKILDEGLSVRQTEELVKRIQNAKPPKEKQPDPNEIYYRQAETDLGSALGRKVHIDHGARKRGTIRLEYYDMDDLNDLLEALAKLKK